METVNLDSTEWVLYFANGWKGHFCPASLLPGLMQDAGARGHGDGEFKQAHRGVIDLPGMIMSDRTYQTIRVEGFNLDIPTEDFEYFHDELKRARARVFEDGKEYYKIHGWLHCVVFTPDQREFVLERMEELLAVAKVKAEEERNEFTRRIREINRGGTKVITAKAPESIPKSPVTGKKNSEKN